MNKAELTIGQLQAMEMHLIVSAPVTRQLQRQLLATMQREVELLEVLKEAFQNNQKRPPMYRTVMPLLDQIGVKECWSEYSNNTKKEGENYEQ